MTWLRYQTNRPSDTRSSPHQPTRTNTPCPDEAIEDADMTFTLVPSVDRMHTPESSCSVRDWMESPFTWKSSTSSITQDECNHNETKCITSPSAVPLISTNLWTEGLPWPTDELIVVCPNRSQKTGDANTHSQTTDSYKKGHVGGKSINKCDEFLKTITTSSESDDPFLASWTQATTTTMLMDCIERSSSPTLPSKIEQVGIELLQTEQLSKDWDSNVKKTCTNSGLTLDSRRAFRMKQYMNMFFPRHSEQNMAHDILDIRAPEPPIVTSKPPTRKINLKKQEFKATAKVNTRWTGLEQLEKSQQKEGMIKKHQVNTEVSSNLPVPEPSTQPQQKSIMKFQQYTNPRPYRYIIAPTLTTSTPGSVPPRRRHIRQEDGDGKHSRHVVSQSRERIDPTTIDRKRMKNIRTLSQAIQINSSTLSGDNKAPHRRARERQGRCDEAKQTVELKVKKRLEEAEKPTQPAPVCKKPDTFLDKMARMNTLSKELNRMHGEFVELQTYNRLGKFYSLSDAYVHVLSAQLAPHILKATMGWTKIKRFMGRHQSGKRNRFASMQLLSLQPSKLNNLLLLLNRNRCAENASRHTLSAQYREKTHDRLSNTRDNPSFKVTKLACNSNTHSNRRATWDQVTHSRVSRQPRSNSRSLQRPFQPCQLVGLPLWEQRRLGIQHTKLPKGTTVIGWRDPLHLNQWQLDWLNKTASRLLMCQSKARLPSGK